MKIKIFLAGFTLALLSVSAFGQTSSDLEKKYGAPKSFYEGSPLVYEVRPGLIMIVKFSQDGQACELFIKQIRKEERNINESNFLSDELIKTLIGELILAPERNNVGYPKGIGFWFGQTGVMLYESKDVSIGVGHASINIKGEFQDKILGPITIKWKNRVCVQK